MTKEEILKKNAGISIDYRKVSAEQPLCLKWAMRSMDEYAKQESMEFANWRDDNYSRVGVSDGWVDLSQELPEILTTNQLYNIYLTYKQQETKT